MLMLDQLVGFKNIFTFSRVCSQACEHTVYLTNLKCNVLCIYRMAHANWAGSVRKKIQKNFRNLKHAIVAKHIADVLIESGALSLEDWETLKHKPLSEPDRMEELLFRIIKYNREHYVSFLRALVHAGKSSIALDLIVDDINWLEVSGSSDPSAPIIDASLNRGRTREALQDNRITQTLNDLSTNFPDTNDQHVTRREAEADLPQRLMEKRIHHLESKLADQENRHREKVGELSRELDYLKQQLVVTRPSDDVIQERNALHAQVRAFIVSTRRYDHELRSCRSMNDTLVQENETLKNEKKLMSDELHSIKRENDRLKRDTINIQAQLHHAKMEQSELQSQRHCFVNMHAAYDALNMKNTHLEDEIRLLKSKIYDASELNHFH